MEIKTYSKVEIFSRNITFKKIHSRGEKHMIALMEYTQMVFTNIKYQVMQKILSTV